MNDHRLMIQVGGFEYASTCIYFIFHLRLFDGGIVPIAHGRDVHAGLPLLVALPEELLHQPVNPLPVYVEGLGGVGQVRAVHHVLQHLDAIRVVVEVHDPGPRHLFGLYHRLEVGQEIHVLRHVRGKDLWLKGFEINVINAS